MPFTLMQMVGVVQGQEPQEETGKIESTNDQQTAATAAATATPAIESNAMDVEKDGIRCVFTHSLHDPKSLVNASVGEHVTCVLIFGHVCTEDSDTRTKAGSAAAATISADFPQVVNKYYIGNEAMR